MPYMTDLKPALIRFGLGPYLEEVPGWETRGSSSFAPACTIGHHTAGPLSGDRPSLDICVNGRSDLPGPLCNDFLSRSKVILVAAGRANHAGTGGFRGLVGNSAAFGNEAESNGVGRPDGSPDWSEFQRWAFPRVHAAHLWLLGRDESWYAGHRDWTDRKIDPTDVSTAALRLGIAALLANPTPAPVIDPRGPEMRVLRVKDAGARDGQVYTVTDLEAVWVRDPAIAAAAQKVWGEAEDVSAREIDVLAYDANARRHRQRAEVVAAVAKAIPGVNVDEQALAAELAPAVIAALGEAKGLTAEDVEAALRSVLGSLDKAA